MKVWATFGALILAFEAYVIFQWVTGPYFTPVDIGASEVPDWMEISLHAQEVVFGVILALVIWHFIVQPLRKERRMTSDGLLCIAIFVFAWFQDPIANYSGAIFTYNSGLLDMGSWVNEVPGAVTQGQPGAQISEGLWDAMIYPGVLFLGTVLGTWFMRKVKQGFPGTRTLGLLGTLFAFMIFVDFIMEAVILMPLGGYTYPGAPDWTSINIDHYYKYTFLEGLTFGASWAPGPPFGTSRTTRAARSSSGGSTRCEAPTPEDCAAVLRDRRLRLPDDVPVHNGPWNWMALHQSEWPEDIQERTYFTQGLCGADTTFACAGPSVPLPLADESGASGPTARWSSRRAPSCRSSSPSTGGRSGRRGTDAAEAGPVGGPTLPN